MESVFQNITDEAFQERIDLIRHKLKFIDQKPTVACIGELEPLSIAGGTINEMVGIAGGVAAADISIQNPDIMVVMLKGLSIEETMKHINLLLQQPGFADLKAVKNNRVYIADGSRYFYNDGPNLVDSAEIMAEIINPKQFIFGYEGNGWIKFSV